HAVSGGSPAERCRFPAWRPECYTHARARLRRSLSSCRPGPRRSHRTSGRTRAARLLGLRRRHLRGSVSPLALLRGPPESPDFGGSGRTANTVKVWWKVTNTIRGRDRDGFENRDRAVGEAASADGGTRRIETAAVDEKPTVVCGDRLRGRARRRWPVAGGVGCVPRLLCCFERRVHRQRPPGRAEGPVAPGQA